jgi:hypothetical protein
MTTPTIADPLDIPYTLRDDLKEHGYDATAIRDEHGHAVLIGIPLAHLMLPVKGALAHARLPLDVASLLGPEIQRAHDTAERIERRTHLPRVSPEDLQRMKQHGIEQRLDGKWGFKLHCARPSCLHRVDFKCYAEDTLDAAVQAMTTRRSRYYCNTECYLSHSQAGNDAAWRAMMSHAKYAGTALSRELPRLVKQALSHTSDEPPQSLWLATPHLIDWTTGKLYHELHPDAVYLEDDLRALVVEILLEEMGNWDDDTEEDGEADCDAG